VRTTDGLHTSFIIESTYMHSYFFRPRQSTTVFVTTSSTKYTAIFLSFTTRYYRNKNQYYLLSLTTTNSVTTRTTSLVSIPHPSFALRFSSLNDVEVACREDDDQRAVRTLDWMTARIINRSVKWVQDTVDKEPFRTPWWDELRRCAEGDFVPSKSEAWNHPVARTFLFFITDFFMFKSF